MFEDEVAAIDAMVLNPGDLCILLPAVDNRRKIKKNVCLVIESKGNSITVLKSNVGIINVPKGWLRKIDLDETET